MKKNYQSVCVLSICGIFLFYKYISQLFPSLISSLLIEQLRLSAVGVGILASSYYYSYSIMQVFSGIMLDKFSVKASASLAMMIVAIAMFGFAYTDSFMLMCLCRALMGVGCAFATTLYLKCAALCTSDRTFGFVSSLLATATMLGAAVGAGPVAILFEKTGWYHGLIYIGCVGVVLSILAFMFMNLNPSQLTKGNKSSPNIKNSLMKVVSNSTNIKLLFYSGLTFSPVIVIGGLWGIPFLQLKLQISSSEAATLISTMFIGHAVGSPVWALLNAQINNRKHLMIAANAMAITCISCIIFAALNYSLMMMVLFLFGFAVGCFMLSFEICRETNGIAVMGIAVAFVNSGEGIVGIILEPGIGFILDMVKSSGAVEFSLANYQLGLSILPICYIISTWIVMQMFNKQPKNINQTSSILVENMA